LPALISINAPAMTYRELFEKSLIDTRKRERERERERERKKKRDHFMWQF